MTVPDMPFFVGRIAPRNSGVDFLGLAPVGERLIGVALPGINNVTRYVRAYSMASWVAWRFEEFLRSRDRQSLQAEPKVLFRRFREKIELTFSWANKDFAATIGKRRKYPAEARSLEMAFTNPIFGSESQASWFAAAAYGPSFASTSGLGFVQLLNAPADARGVARPTALGTDMARGIDGMLQKAGTAYRRLADVLDYRGSSNDSEHLAPCLALDKLSVPEKRVFRDALFVRKLVGQYDGGQGNRASTIELILRSLGTAGELDIQGVRESLARGLTKKGKPIDLTSVRRTQRLWFVLSVRQLQRVALERLLTWFETTILESAGRPLGMTEVQDLAERQMRDVIPKDSGASVDEFLKYLEGEIERRGGPERAGLEEDWLNVFDLRERLVLTVPDDLSSIPAVSLAALLLCAAIVKATQEDASLREAYALGGGERCGLRWFAKFLESRGGSTLAEAIREIVSSLVYAQHLRTAAARFEEGKNKFRFTMDEAGLQLLIDAGSINGQLDTPDRIASVLHLMSDCGLLYEYDGRYSAI